MRIKTKQYGEDVRFSKKNNWKVWISDIISSKDMAM